MRVVEEATPSNRLDGTDSHSSKLAGGVKSPKSVGSGKSNKSIGQAIDKDKKFLGIKGFAPSSEVDSNIREIKINPIFMN